MCFFRIEKNLTGAGVFQENARSCYFEKRDIGDACSSLTGMKVQNKEIFQGAAEFSSSVFLFGVGRQLSVLILMASDFQDCRMSRQAMAATKAAEKNRPPGGLQRDDQEEVDDFRKLCKRRGWFPDEKW